MLRNLIAQYSQASTQDSDASQLLTQLSDFDGTSDANVSPLTQTQESVSTSKSRVKVQFVTGGGDTDDEVTRHMAAFESYNNMTGPRPSGTPIGLRMNPISSSLEEEEEDPFGLSAHLGGSNSQMMRDLFRKTQSMAEAMVVSQLESSKKSTSSYVQHIDDDSDDDALWHGSFGANKDDSSYSESDGGGISDTVSGTSGYESADSTQMMVQSDYASQSEYSTGGSDSEVGWIPPSDGEDAQDLIFSPTAIENRKQIARQLAESRDPVAESFQRAEKSHRQPKWERRYELEKDLKRQEKYDLQKKQLMSGQRTYRLVQKRLNQKKKRNEKIIAAGGTVPSRRRDRRHTAMRPPDKAMDRLQFLGSVPPRAQHVVPVYSNQPYFTLTEDAHFQGVPRHYLRGELGYIKFPQRDMSVQVTQQAMVRELWHRSFFGLDYEGAAMCIKVLSEVDNIKLQDVEMLTELLRMSKDSLIALTRFHELIAKHVKLRRNALARMTLVSKLVQSAVFEGEVNTPKEWLRTIQKDVILASSGTLAVYQLTLLCLDAINLAQHVNNFFEENHGSSSFSQSSQKIHSYGENNNSDDSIDLPTIPSIDECTNEPLLFYIPLRIICMLVEGQGDRRLANLQRQAVSLLRDIEVAFVRANTIKDNIDLQAIFLAYLMAKQEHKKAVDLIEKLHIHFIIDEPVFPNAEETFTQPVELDDQHSVCRSTIKPLFGGLKFYQLLSRAIVFFSTAFSLQPNQVKTLSAIQIAWQRHSMVQLSPSSTSREPSSQPLVLGTQSSVYHAWVKYQAGILTNGELLVEVSSMVEKFSPYDMATMAGGIWPVLPYNHSYAIRSWYDTVDQYHGVPPEPVEQPKDGLGHYLTTGYGGVHWVLWRLLANLLSEVDYLELTDPIDKEANAQLTGDINQIVSQFQEIRLENGQPQPRTNIKPSPFGNPDSLFTSNVDSQPTELIEHMRSHRKWWMDVILAANLLEDQPEILSDVQVDAVLSDLSADPIQQTAKSLFMEFPLIECCESHWQDNMSKRIEVDHAYSAHFNLDSHRPIDNADALLHKIEEMPFIKENITHLEARWAAHQQPNEPTPLAELTEDEPLLREHITFCVHGGLPNSPSPISRTADQEHRSSCVHALEEWYARLFPIYNPEDFQVQRWVAPADFFGNGNDSSSTNDMGREMFRQMHRNDTHMLLGPRMMEILTFQALVASHISSPDSLFVVRVVLQLIKTAAVVKNDSSLRSWRLTALLCLAYLDQSGLNIERCYQIARAAFLGNVNASSAVPAIYSLPIVSSRLEGTRGLFYEPIPFVPKS